MPDTPGDDVISGALGLVSGGNPGATPAPDLSAGAGASPTPAAPATPAAPSATGGSQPQPDDQLPFHTHPRFQELVQQKNEFKTKYEAAQADAELGQLMRMAQEGDPTAARMVAAQIGAEIEMVDDGAGAAAGVPGQAAAPLSRSELEQTLSARDQQNMRQMAVWSKVQQMHRDGLEFKDEDVYAAMIDRGINDPEDAYRVLNHDAIIQRAVEADREARGANAAAQVAASQNVPPGTSPSASTVPSSQEPTFQGKIVQAHLASNNPLGQIFPGMNLGQRE